MREKFRNYHWRLFALVMLGMSPAHGLDEIPTETGWRGFFLFGLGYADGKSNLIAGNDAIDIGRNTVGSVTESASSKDDVFPFVGGEISYTFKDRLQVFFGGTVEDWVRLDLAQQLGVRKQFEVMGIFSAGILLSAFPAEVWSDPYVANQPRSKADRDSTGLRFQWDRIIGSPLELRFQWREIDVDRESSGSFLGLSAGERGQLDRNGDDYQVSLIYRILTSSRTQVQPQITWTKRDRNGSAVSGDAWSLGVTAGYIGQKWIVGGTGSFGKRDMDAANPVYGRKTDSDFYSLGLNVFYQLPFKSRRWSINGSVVRGEDDTDVNFHDQEITVLSLGMVYRFGPEFRQR